MLFLLPFCVRRHGFAGNRKKCVFPKKKQTGGSNAQHRTRNGKSYGCSQCFTQKAESGSGSNHGDAEQNRAY